MVQAGSSTPNRQQGTGFDSDENIQSINYGGLNSMSSVLNIPESDSPDLLNVQVEENGDIGKRLGSRLLQTESVTNAQGLICIAFSLRSGKDLIISKQNKDIKVFEFFNNDFRTVMTKSNVWSDAAAGVKPDFVTTSEIDPRIIFTSGVNVPVQLTFVESTATWAGGSTTFTFDDTRFEFATGSNCGVWLDDTHYPTATVSYSAPTVTVTFPSSIVAGTYIFSIVFITWQWWAEAIKLLGNQIYAKTNKFHVNIDDQSIAINTNLLRDIEEIDYGDYPIWVYTSSDYNDVYTYKTNRKPTLETEWNFSTGGRYDTADGDEILPGISHVTFGAIKGGTPDSDPVHYIRGYKLRFNGELGESVDNLLVKVDDVTYTHNSTGAASGTQTSSPTYQVRLTANANWRTATIASTTTVVDLITFDSTATIGLSSTSFVEIISTKPSSNNTYVGTGATANYNRITPRDGAIFPAYGIGIFSNYDTGSFPRSCTIFQGRLIFAGFPNQPMTVLLSNVFDSVRVGTFFNNYQIALEDATASDPIDVLLSAEIIDDLLLACVEFQNQLFVWSSISMFRLHGGTVGAVTPTNLLINSVSGTGVLNSQAVVKIDKTVLFLSNSGVFDITATLEAGDFTAGERSIKIRNLVSGPLVPNNQSVAWMTYDPANYRVYLAVSDDVQSLAATKFFVYDVLRQAWLPWANQSGALFSLSGTVIRVSANQTFLLIAQTPFSNYPTSVSDVEYLIFDSFYPIDRMQELTNQSTYDVGEVKQVTHTFDLDVLAYKTDIKSTNSQAGFLMSPVLEAQDVEVLSGSTVLTFGTDYRKTANNEIYFLKVQPESATITIRLLDENLDYPIGVYRDNILLTETDDYTVAIGTGNYVVTLNSAADASAIIRVGLSYLSYFQTPVFFRDDLSSKKRLFHFHGLFSNERVMETYASTDRNVAASQTVEEIVATYKRDFSANMAVLFDFRGLGYQRADLYGFKDIYWDQASYDIDPSSFQSVSHSIVSQPLIGITRSFSIVIWSSSTSLFDMSGYQILANRQVRSSVHWSV